MSAAIVTGAANGIGAACARAFAQAGWDLVLVDRDAAALNRVAGSVAGRVETLVGDVASHEVNSAAVARAEDRFGSLDAAVANAGVNLARSLDDTTDEDIDRLLAVNLRAVVYLAQAAHRALARSTGSLVVMASKTGLVAQPDSPIYCATKGAAIQLARALALDWASEGIRVNAVCPGIVDTPMLEGFFEQLADPERARRDFATAQPLGGSPAPRSARRRRCSWPPRGPRSSRAWRCRSTGGSRPSELRVEALHDHEHRKHRRLRDPQPRRRRGRLRRHRCPRRVPQPDRHTRLQPAGRDADPGPRPLRLRAGHRPFPRRDRRALPGHPRHADDALRRGDPLGQRAGGGARRAEDARSHRNEGDEPVEMWAISRILGRSDSTKLDGFWEASPDAVQRAG